MTGRELFASEATKRGEVTLPVNFDDISVLMGLSMEDSITREQLGGMFYGFYYNPCVYAQNDINDKLLTVLKEFREQEKIKQDLFSRINVLQDRLDELT